MNEWISKHQAYAVAWGIIIPDKLETLDQRRAVKAHCRAYANKHGYHLAYMQSPDTWHMVAVPINNPGFVTGTLQECMLYLVKQDQELLPTP